MTLKRRTLLSSAGAFGILGLAGCTGSIPRSTTTDGTQTTSEDRELLTSAFDPVVLHTTPNCPCCEKYVEYLESRGASVDTERHQDYESFKADLNIPEDVYSCHTVTTDDYVFEGHIPVSVINDFFSERPDARGLALPEMPPGSPGMPGTPKGEETVYALHDDGRTSEYAVISGDELSG